MNFKFNGTGYLFITYNLTEICLCISYRDLNKLYKKVNIYFQFARNPYSNSHNGHRNINIDFYAISKIIRMITLVTKKPILQEEVLYFAVKPKTIMQKEVTPFTVNPFIDLCNSNLGYQNLS